MLLILTLLFTSCCFDVMAVRGRGGARKRPINDNSVPHVADIEPAARSRAQWELLSVEALRLACNNAHLVSSGARQTLINQLVAFYAPSAAPAEHSTSVLVCSTSTPSTTTHTAGVTSTTVVPVCTSTATRSGSSVPADGAGVVSSQSQHPATHAQQQTLSVDISALVSEEVRRCLGSLQSQHHAVNGHTASASSPDNNNTNTGNSSNSHHSSPLSNLLAPLGAVCRSSATDLPVLSKSTMEKIRNEEFINLDSLLPNFTPMTQEDYSFRFVGGMDSPTVSLVPKDQSRPKISNFNSWMVSWSNFMRAYVHFHSHRVHELIKYQSIMCDFAGQFSFSAWINYDRMFRLRLAQDPSLSWARVDDDIYNRFLRHAPLQNVCFLCRNFGHYSSNCHLRAGGSGSGSSPFRASQRAGASFRESSTASADRSGDPPLRPQGPVAPAARRYTCNYFNAGGCSSRACRFEHICASCFGKHSASRCPKRHDS